MAAAEGDAERAAAPAHVQQRAAPREVDETGDHVRGPERARVLGDAEPARLLGVLDLAVEVDPLAAQRHVEMRERGIDLARDLEAKVVAEVHGRAAYEVRGGGRRVDVPISLHAEEAEPDAGAEQRDQPVRGHPGLVREQGRLLGPSARRPKTSSSSAAKSACEAMKP